MKLAEYFLRRCGYIKRNTTRAARKVPPNFEDLKSSFLHQILSEIEQYAIPPKWIISWDQTGSNLVPVSQWTLAEQGSRQVPVVARKTNPR